MHHGFSHNPALIIALALAAGVIAQSVARHLRIPGIVLLLGVGVVLGPDVLCLITPQDLGPALQGITGFAVAIILFEGGLNLDLKRMRRQAPAIRRLLSLGVVVTTVGGALAARWLLGWDWTPSILFGTLVIVTGPTVVTPLLRRIKVKRSVETILESEGVLIDAVGAVVAVVALEIALGSSLAAGAASAPTRLLVGGAIGAVGGLLLWLLLRLPHVVPEGFENILALAWAVALFQVSNAITHESGIMAAVVAGGVVGNAPHRLSRELREFKEQLTVLLIGLLFVLLAADVRIREVVALGWPGLFVVLALMFVVRPLNILACTWRTGLSGREKAFLSWVAPRGIVAAAVASLFAERLASEGGDVGGQLRALVFLVIAATVVVQGATAGFMAGVLKVRRPSGRGWAILGAQPLGRLVAKRLKERDHEVVLIDANARLCSEAEREGLKVVMGNAFDESVLLRAQMDTRRAALGICHNEAINLLFARTMREEAHVPRVLAAAERNVSGVDPSHLVKADVQLLFGNETDLEMWSSRIRRGQAALETWRRVVVDEEDGPEVDNGAVTSLLPVIRIEDGKDEPVTGASRFGVGVEVDWLVSEERRDTAEGWLRTRGWDPVAETGSEPTQGV